MLPTDTVYGLGVDAFEPDGVQRLLDAKGRGRDMPPPVLISSDTTLEALATELPGWASGLVEHYWPGPLTIVCRQQPSLRWDLGETRGTVAIRMPDDEARPRAARSHRSAGRLVGQQPRPRRPPPTPTTPRTCSAGRSR